MNCSALTLPTDRLIDYLCIAGVGDTLNASNGGPVDVVPESGLYHPLLTEFSPDLLSRYPLVDYADTPFPTGVASFCFPFGIRLRQPRPPEEPLPVYFTFVATGSKGEHVYGHSITFWERVTAEQAAGVHPLMLASSSSSPPSGSGSGSAVHPSPTELRTSAAAVVAPFFAPKCITLLSRWTFPAFRTLLTEAYRLTLSPQPLPFERLIVNVCKEIALPPAGRLQVEYPINNTTLVFRRAAPNRRVSARGLPMREVFECLDLNNLLALLRCALCERQILLVSSQLSLLTATGEVLVALMYPLRWTHAYIPILPRGLLGVVHAPTPFLLGVHTEHWRELREEVPPGVVQVHLDTNTILVTPEEEGFFGGPVPSSGTAVPVPLEAATSTSSGGPAPKAHHTSRLDDGSLVIAPSPGPSLQPQRQSHGQPSGGEAALERDLLAAGVPRLSERHRRKLLQSLVKHGDAFAHRGDDWAESRLPNYDSAFDFAMRPGDMGEDGADDAPGGGNDDDGGLGDGGSDEDDDGTGEPGAYSQQLHRPHPLPPGRGGSSGGGEGGRYAHGMRGLGLGGTPSFAPSSHLISPRVGGTAGGAGTGGKLGGYFGAGSLRSGVRVNWHAVRRAFFRQAVSLFSRYREALVFPSASDPSPRHRFDRELFLRESPPDARPLLAVILSTQAFANFVDDRIQPEAETDVDVEFVDQSIDAKLNRSRFTFNKRETPFLTSTEFTVTKTVVALAPPVGGLEGYPEFRYTYSPMPLLDPELFYAPRPIPSYGDGGGSAIAASTSLGASNAIELARLRRVGLRSSAMLAGSRLLARLGGGAPGPGGTPAGSSGGSGWWGAAATAAPGDGTSQDPRHQGTTAAGRAADDVLIYTAWFLAYAAAIDVMATATARCVGAAFDAEEAAALSKAQAASRAAVARAAAAAAAEAVPRLRYAPIAQQQPLGGSGSPPQRSAPGSGPQGGAPRGMGAVGDATATGAAGAPWGAGGGSGGDNGGTTRASDDSGGDGAAVHGAASITASSTGTTTSSGSSGNLSWVTSTPGGGSDSLASGSPNGPEAPVRHHRTPHAAGAPRLGSVAAALRVGENRHQGLLPLQAPGTPMGEAAPGGGTGPLGPYGASPGSPFSGGRVTAPSIQRADVGPFVRAAGEGVPDPRGAARAPPTAPSPSPPPPRQDATAPLPPPAAGSLPLVRVLSAGNSRASAATRARRDGLVSTAKGVLFSLLLEEAFGVMSRMKTEGIAPGEAVFRGLLEMCGRCGAFGKAHTVLQQMTAAGIPQDASLYRTVFAAFFHGNPAATSAAAGHALPLGALGFGKGLSSKPPTSAAAAAGISSAGSLRGAGKGSWGGGGGPSIGSAGQSSTDQLRFAAGVGAVGAGRPIPHNGPQPKQQLAVVHPAVPTGASGTVGQLLTASGSQKPPAAAVYTGASAPGSSPGGPVRLPPGASPPGSVGAAPAAAALPPRGAGAPAGSVGAAVLGRGAVAGGTRAWQPVPNSAGRARERSPLSAVVSAAFRFFGGSGGGGRGPAVAPKALSPPALGTQLPPAVLHQYGGAPGSGSHVGGTRAVYTGGSGSGGQPRALGTSFSSSSASSSSGAAAAGSSASFVSEAGAQSSGGVGAGGMSTLPTLHTSLPPSAGVAPSPPPPVPPRRSSRSASGGYPEIGAPRPDTATIRDDARHAGVGATEAAASSPPHPPTAPGGFGGLSNSAGIADSAGPSAGSGHPSYPTIPVHPVAPQRSRAPTAFSTTGLLLDGGALGASLLPSSAAAAYFGAPGENEAVDAESSEEEEMAGEEGEGATLASSLLAVPSASTLTSLLAAEAAAAQPQVEGRRSADGIQRPPATSSTGAGDECDSNGPPCSSILEWCFETEGQGTGTTGSAGPLDSPMGDGAGAGDSSCIASLGAPCSAAGGGGTGTSGTGGAGTTFSAPTPARSGSPSSPPPPTTSSSSDNAAATPTTTGTATAAAASAVGSSPGVSGPGGTTRGAVAVAQEGEEGEGGAGTGSRGSSSGGGRSEPCSSSGGSGGSIQANGGVSDYTSSEAAAAAPSPPGVPDDGVGGRWGPGALGGSARLVQFDGAPDTGGRARSGNSPPAPQPPAGNSPPAPQPPAAVGYDAWLDASSTPTPSSPSSTAPASSSPSTSSALPLASGSPSSALPPASILSFESDVVVLSTASMSGGTGVGSVPGGPVLPSIVDTTDGSCRSTTGLVAAAAAQRGLFAPDDDATAMAAAGPFSSSPLLGVLGEEGSGGDSELEGSGDGGTAAAAAAAEMLMNLRFAGGPGSAGLAEAEEEVGGSGAVGVSRAAQALPMGLEAGGGEEGAAEGGAPAAHCDVGTPAAGAGAPSATAAPRPRSPHIRSSHSSPHPGTANATEEPGAPAAPAAGSAPHSAGASRPTLISGVPASGGAVTTPRSGTTVTSLSSFMSPSPGGVLGSGAVVVEEGGDASPSRVLPGGSRRAVGAPQPQGVPRGASAPAPMTRYSIVLRATALDRSRPGIVLKSLSAGGMEFCRGQLAGTTAQAAREAGAWTPRHHDSGSGRGVGVQGAGDAASPLPPVSMPPSRTSSSAPAVAREAEAGLPPAPGDGSPLLPATVPAPGPPALLGTAPSSAPAPAHPCPGGEAGERDPGEQDVTAVAGTLGLIAGTGASAAAVFSPGAAGGGKGAHGAVKGSDDSASPAPAGSDYAASTTVNPTAAVALPALAAAAGTCPGEAAAAPAVVEAVLLNSPLAGSTPTAPPGSGFPGTPFHAPSGALEVRWGAARRGSLPGTTAPGGSGPSSPLSSTPLRRGSASTPPSSGSPLQPPPARGAASTDSLPVRLAPSPSAPIPGAPGAPIRPETSFSSIRRDVSSVGGTGAAGGGNSGASASSFTCFVIPDTRPWATLPMLSAVSEAVPQLSQRFPDLFIDTLRETCPFCGAPLTDAHIRAGWTRSAQDYLTTCPFCSGGSSSSSRSSSQQQQQQPRRFVARFAVVSSSPAWVGTTGAPGAPLFCEHLPPAVLLKELQTRILNGQLNSSLRESSPTLFYNLLLVFLSYSLPVDWLAFLAGGSSGGEGPGEG